MSQGFSVDHSNVSPGLGAHPSRDYSDGPQWPAGRDNDKQSSINSDKDTSELATEKSLRTEAKEDEAFEDNVDYFELGMPSKNAAPTDS